VTTAASGSADVVGQPLSADDPLVRAYRERTPGSAASFEAARRVLPGTRTRFMIIGRNGRYAVKTAHDHES